MELELDRTEAARALVLDVLVETGASMAFLLGADGSVVDARLPFRSDLGDGRLWQERVDPADRLAVVDAQKRLIADGTPQSAEIWVNTTVGRRRLALRGVNLLHDPLIAAVVVSGVDVTALRAVEADRDAALAELAHRATHDPLTGLANRALVVDRLEHALAQRDVAPAVVFCDLGGFKAVNDRYGHLAGDEVLQEVARRLRSLVRAGDTVGRVGGDEFVLVCERTTGKTADAIARRLVRLLTHPVELKSGPAVCVGAHVGVAVGRPGDRPDDLLGRADEAMYRRKRCAPEP